jgi:four helix bundle protein
VPFAGSAYLVVEGRLQKESIEEMAQIKSYRDLDAWQAAMDLVLLVYGVVPTLPPSEKYELARQVRRAAVSIPSNVAEGQGQGPGARYRHHVRIAMGSLAELETQLELCVRLKFIERRVLNSVQVQLGRTGQLLHGLARSLKPRGDEDR